MPDARRTAICRPRPRGGSQAQAEFLETTSRCRRRSARPVRQSSAAADRRATDEILDHPLDTVAAVPVRVAARARSLLVAAAGQQEVFEGRNHAWEVAGRWFNIVLILPFALLTLVAARVPAITHRSDGCATLVEARRLVPSLALDGRVGGDDRGELRQRAVPRRVEPSLAVLAGLGITIVVTALTQRGRTEPAS